MDPTPPPLASLMDLLVDAVCVVDAEGHYLYVNAAFETIFGYRADEVVGRRMLELVHPDDRERTLEAAGRIMAGEIQRHFQNRYVRKDGRVVDVQWSARWSEADRVRIAVGHDITDLKRADAVQSALLAISEAAHAEGDLAPLFLRIHQIIGRLLPAANCFVALRQDGRDEVDFPYFVDQHDAPPSPLPLESPTLSNEVIRTGQALLITPESQESLPERLRQVIGRDALCWLGVPLVSANGVIGALVVQSYDSATRYSAQDKQLLQFVSAQIAAAIERKRGQAWLRHLASHDGLTGLSNRSRFHERLEQALDTARRDRQKLALLYVDLDGFKRINDSHGHDAGDQVLREVAARLRGCVRQSDLVARLGGDEFAVLLYGTAQAADARRLGEAIRAALERPYVLDGRSLRISASIGVALHPEHGQDKKPLLRHADNAMYRAKREGGNRLAATEREAG